MNIFQWRIKNNDTNLQKLVGSVTTLGVWKKPPVEKETVYKGVKDRLLVYGVSSFGVEGGRSHR